MNAKFVRSSSMELTITAEAFKSYMFELLFILSDTFINLQPRLK